MPRLGMNFKATMLTMLLVLAACANIGQASSDTKLLGVCDYMSTETSCEVYSSLEGGREMQIVGQGFTGNAQDQSVFFKYTSDSNNLATPGPAITRDFAFKSDISRGILYYETPSLEDLLGENIGESMTSFVGEIYTQGDDSTGASTIFSCDSASDCQVTYNIAYTPQIHRIYPSTIYAGQDICFNVFTDYAVYDNRELYTGTSFIGESTMEFETYDEFNQASISVWNDYQICGTAGVDTASDSNDVTIISGAGKYLLTDFAKSYDGTNEYIVRKIPSVTEVSSNTFYKAGGAIVTIKGEGFGVAPTDNTVVIDDVTCDVFEATNTHLKCTLGEKTTTSTATEFIGGMGARVKEYSGYRKSNVDDTVDPTDLLYYTDLASRRNTDENDDSLTRIVEGWFVPPQTGDYIFHASCDDNCEVDLSTTDMDKSAATNILTVGLNDWRNFWNPSPSSFNSAPQTLEAGKHYYIKVTHEESSGNDYMTVGFTIDDNSTAHPNSYLGWKSISIEPHHTFEKYEVILPNDTDAVYRLQFDGLGSCTGVSTASDVFQCDSKTCPCVSSSFKATDNAGSVKGAVRDYFNKIHSYLGSHLSVTKETLDTNGDVTTVAADVSNYKFTFEARYALSSPSSTEPRIYSNSAGVTASVSRVANSTQPLDGRYRIQVPFTNGTTVETEEISLNTYNGHITRQIYKAAPELIGKVEVNVATGSYLSGDEGRELYYRISGHPNLNLRIIDGLENPLTGGIESETETIEFLYNDNVIPASNSPFYEVIPGPMMRAVETSPQVVVTSNNLAGACPTSGACDITFIDDVGEITSRTCNYPYSTMDLFGTDLPHTEINYVSVGHLRRCEIDAGTLSVNGLSCTTANMIAGTHNVVVQSDKGAIKNSAAITDLDIDIVVDDVQPISIHTSGGQSLTVTGKFFPKSLAEANTLPDFAVTFTDGSECTVTKVSTTEIVCKTPAGLADGTTLTVAFNGKTQTYGTALTVGDSAETVTAIDKTNVCPVLKQDLVITVSNVASADPNDYVAVLVSTEKTIYMRVNSVDTGANTLTARFPGSPSNIDYHVYVEYNGERFKSDVVLTARSTITAYEITTDLPTAKTSISTTGGDIIKITGTGFSTTLSDNVVVFGDSYTKVLTATETELTVRAGSNPTDGDVEIKVFLKLSIESECNIGTGCTITYDNTQAPTLDSPNTALTPSDGVITIAGSGFGDNPVGYIDGYAQETVSSSQTQIQIKLTAMNDNEMFSLEVRTDTINLPTVYVDQPLSPALTNVSPHVGSSGGQKVTLSTIGLGLTKTSNLKVYYEDGATSVEICDSITLVDSSTVECITTPGDITTNTLKLSYTHASTTAGSTQTITLACTTASDCQYETSAAATPAIDSLTKTNGETRLELTVSGITFDASYTVTVYYGNMKATANAFESTTSVKADFASGFPPGDVGVKVSFEKDGEITYTAPYTENVALSASINAAQSCSWAGGCVIELGQRAILEAASAGDLAVEVCGNEAEIREDDSGTDSLIVWAPSYATTHSLDNYKVEEPHLIQGTVTSVPSDEGANAFDGVTSTMFVSYADDNCYVQVKFDDGKVGRLERVKYFMNRMTDKQSNFVDHLKFQTSSDGTTWNDEFTADTYLREGWNTYTPTNALKYQYYRFFSETKGACQIGEIQLWGNIVEDITDTSKVCDVVVKAAGGLTQTFSNQVTYSDAASSAVTGISPRYGTYKGGETVTFTGTGFSSTISEVTVTIDGIDCAVTSATSTEVQCTTGARPNVNPNPSTILSFSGSNQNGHASMQTHSYKYANYWSDLDTWSGEFIPQDGDTVHIPAGQTLIVDVDSTAILKAVLVEGALIFAPDADPNHHRTFDAEYVFVGKGAVFEAGTEDNRYTSKLTITMHGTRESPQIPVYGNKGIFVRYGQLDIHGVVRDYTWTELATTVEKGSNQITLNVKTDWQVGEEIVIAPTDFEVDHAEVFEITEVDNSGATTVLTLNTTTDYKHYAGSKDYTGSNGVNADMTKTLEMRAEVGLLTRNVVYKGADDDSVAKRYGAHIMMHSPGDDSLTGRISYAEFTQVGQAFQLGRYPIHFHMIGAIHNSYIQGNAIHHTYNRACTIHGVHYLTVKDNVAFETMGHTFFIEDGAETKNLIQNNLAIKTKRSWSLLNTDQTPASFWITHPDNQFIGNHAGGSDRYGFWFDLQIHPTGPSFDPNICPEFDQLGEFTGNVAHSNGRYGLRIFHRFTPVTNPCLASAGGAHNNREQPDPTISVPIVTHFRDFLGYKNKRTALIAEELGALKFHNIRAADNLLSGVEFGLTAAGPWLTSSDDYHLQDALIVGASDNVEPIQTTHGAATTYRGLKGARTEKMRIKDTLFANFNYDSRWAAIGTCSHCEGPATDSSGRTYFTKNLYFVDSTQRVRFDIPFKEIIYDEDGTLGNSTHRWIVHYFNHLDVPECERNEANYNGLMCSDEISIRRVVFDQPKPDNALKGQPLKIMNTMIIPTARRNLATVSPSTCPTDTTLASTISEWDTTSYTLQQNLLQKYDDLRAARETYTTNLNLAEQNNDDDAAATAASALETINSLQAELTTLEDQRKEYSGLYDNLHKTSQTFCNTNNYQNFDFRLKANPTKNWVFPVITGYEYKVHLANAQDFTQMTGSYSYAELLQGETAGVVLHFNHTERTEAFDFIYTNSSSNSNAKVTAKDSAFTLADSNMKMGDMYMNNVTRHMMLKFDGQDEDRLSFTLKREECITEHGCNFVEMPDEGEIESEYRYWSDASSWTDVDSETGIIPGEGDDVVIHSTWNMVLDLTDPPVFNSIEINGRLTIQNDGKSYHLQSYLVYVRKGELIVGTKDEPFTGEMTFTLHGDRSSIDVYFHDKMFEAGNKVIANTGFVQMYGKPIETHWTRLAAPAPAGQNWILLTDTPTDWVVGDELGINPSGRDYTQRDFAVIQSIDGNNVTLVDALSFTHYGAASVDPEVSGSIDIRAEVVHLTRNIKIQGTNEDRWGGHLVTAHNEDSGFVNGQLVTVKRQGLAYIDHVEFLNCSQYDTDKAAVRFADFSDLVEGEPRSFVTNSAIHNGLGIGIMVTSADDVIVDNNVVFFQHIGGIWMKASHNTTITNNVVGGMGTRYWSTETKLDEIAGFNLCNKDQNCKDLIVKNNVMGGGERVGFAIPTHSCSETSNYENNLAHTVQHGFWLFENRNINVECASGFRAYKTIEQGVLAYQAYGQLQVSDVETLDCGRGVTLQIGGNQDTNYITLKNAIIFGESEELPQDSGSHCISIYGYWLSLATQGGKVFPESKLSMLPYEKPKSYGNWFTEAVANNVTFKKLEITY